MTPCVLSSTVVDMSTQGSSNQSVYRYTVKYDERGRLGMDSFMIGSAFKLLVRVYGPVAS